MAYGDTSNRRGAVTAGASVPGYLWLVDVTGAYPLRAHCMGGGLTKTSAKTKAGVDEASSDIVPVADVVNRKLLELLRTERLSGTKRLSYFDVTAEEGLKKMLGLLSSSGLEGGESSLHGPLLQHGTRLELATVDAAQQRIVRKRVSDIWGSGKRGQQIPSPY